MKKFFLLGYVFWFSSYVLFLNFYGNSNEEHARKALVRVQHYLYSFRVSICSNIFDPSEITGGGFSFGICFHLGLLERGSNSNLKEDSNENAHWPGSHFPLVIHRTIFPSSLVGDRLSAMQFLFYPPWWYFPIQENVMLNYTIIYICFSLHWT